MPLTRAELHAFCSYAQKIQAERSIPNFVLSIIHPAENILFANGPSTDTNTLFAVGSLSKAFAATVIAHLVDKNRINWNDSICQFIDIKLPENVDLTIRQMLSHMNRFPEHALTEASEFGFSRTELIKKLRYVKLNKEIKFSYQNILFSLVADIVESVTGQTYQDYLREHILKPLGMLTTTVCEKEYLENGNKASPHIKHDDLIANIPYSPYWNEMGPPSCIATSISDLTRWMKFHLQIDNTFLISKKSLEVVHTPDADAKPPYAMGWWKADEQGLVLSHTGSVTGFESAIAIIPSCKIGIAVSCNLSGNSFPYDLVNHFMQRFLNEKTFSCKNALQLQMPLLKTMRPLTNYIGDFYHPILENIKIIRKQDSLQLEISKKKTIATLSPISVLASHAKITQQLLQLSQYQCFKISWQSGMKAAGIVYYDNDIISFVENEKGVMDAILFYAESIDASLLICKRAVNSNDLLVTQSLFKVNKNERVATHAHKQIQQPISFGAVK